MARSKYMRPRSTRMEQRNMAGRFRGGKLNPVKMVAVRESESGSLTQSITLELDPIAGRMLTPITAEVIAVYVPLRAARETYAHQKDYIWSDEVLREELLSGENMFPLENEHEISKRCGVEPRSINGQKQVSAIVRSAHNAAVNYLRRRKYVKATQVANGNRSVTPAILGMTVLDRLNAVLDPEDRVNGAVNLNMPTVSIPVRSQSSGETGGWHRPTSQVKRGEDGHIVWESAVEAANGIWIETDQLNGGQISTTDFYVAEKMDELTREMRQLVDDDPQLGEELVGRYAHGLSMDMGNQPFVMYENQQVFGMVPERAMDGPSLGQVQTNSVTQFNYTLPIPPTEFGGVIITFACVKPDETLEHQPHPILSAEWGARNYVADELALDPVPVTVRDLYADCAQADENTIVCYNGNNHLLRRYVNYGFNRHLDPTTVENKTAIWQIRIPMSVTPDSVIYPQDLDHYPFADQQAEICTYNCQTRARIATPIIFGPTPVEELAAIEDLNIFEDAPDA